MRLQIQNREDGSTFEYEVTKPEIYVGTSSTNDVVVYQPSLSGRHLKLRLNGEACEVIDLESRTGTFLNGKRVRGSRPFTFGDVISLGSYTLSMLEDHVEEEQSARKEIYWDILESPDKQYDESLVPIKQEIHKRLIAFLDLRRMDLKNIDETELRVTTSRAIWSIMDAMGEEIPGNLDREKLHKEMMDEVLGLGPIEDLIKDPEVTEIMVNRKDQIFVEIRGKLYLTSRSFASDLSLLGIIERIVSPLGRRIDESVPMVDARLRDGSRVNAVIMPLSLKGPALTIRKFASRPFTSARLIEAGSITPAVCDFLQTAVTHRKNIVISGGTSSGKTTLLNVLCAFLPKYERIITVEDSAELQLPQEHLISLEARPPNIQGRGEVTIRDLVRNCLRMRPDRIVVGEVRGGEALDMLQAMNTGHDGSLTTAHANSPYDALRRLETMVLMAGMDLPVRVIREQIASAIHIVVQLMRFRDGSRRLVNVTEVLGLDGEGSYQTQEIFIFKQHGVSQDGKVLGRIVPTGSVPRCYHELAESGIPVNMELFTVDGAGRN
ncbi:MAG: ATPase, T2SS/T4P/T4SS family [bacterium]